MKTLFSLLTLTLIATASHAQIEIKKYNKKTSADVEALADVPAVVAKSACGEVTTTVKETRFSGGCMGVMERLYTFTDECGNKATASQYIHLNDDKAPVFKLADVTVAMTAEEIANLPEPKTTDNSNRQVELKMEQHQEGNNVVQTFTATDLCGNTSSYTRSIALKVAN